MSPSNGSSAQRFREEYNPPLFVGRDQLLTEIEQWATAPLPSIPVRDQVLKRRVVNIKAPPGYGKTWLLKEAHRRLALREGIFPILMDAVRLAYPGAADAWLKELIEEAKKRFGHRVITDYDSTVPIGDVIRTLIEDLWEGGRGHYIGRRPILIVDAWDDVSEDSLREEWLEKKILEAFWRKDYVRILIGMRNDYRLTSAFLRRDEGLIELPPLTPQDGIKQLRRRAQSLSTPIPEDLLEIIPPYRWDIPSLNSFLSNRAGENRKIGPPLLKADNLQKCRREVIGPQLTDALDDYLREISFLRDDWTDEMFGQRCNLKPSRANEVVEQFLKLGVVSRMVGTSLRFKISDGLRELMQAERKLR